ncbi:ABC transporter ATP-binding protein [Salisediminibacterium beveridgei]|uniref:Hydroxymethylpyrimidine ABC transporter, ATPase component n=1 Tax=Salisediminibacterium beveridgei TaxID=632773 RepID=A0A1D7QWU7_9BACI|nr:ABC transporter ATP-binding protein [Salisediminibacterium beveridgei]AOM83482.1 Hydroxymethylpyrimidine ABC transporter, ATPase component [Salisediminibacterium beveridgei]
MAELTFEDVSFAYGGSSVFTSFNLSVQKGEFVTVLGPSGVGKSTLFRLIAGLENPHGGRILLRDRETTNRLGKIGYMPQQDLLLPWRTILENGLLPLEIQGIQRKEAKKQVMAYIEKFGLAGTEHQFPHELSGGMRQRVSFLRAYLGGNDVILLDEPFSALDSFTRFAMQEWLLAQWRDVEKTIVFITHDIEEAVFLSDRILLMNDCPVSGVCESVEVNLPRPRVDEQRSTEAFMALKQELLRKIRGGRSVW